MRWVMIVLACAGCDRGGGYGERMDGPTDGVSMQVVTVSGHVTNNATPVSNITVSLRNALGAGATVTTGATGQFSITGTVSEILLDVTTTSAFAPSVARVPLKPDVAQYLSDITLVAVTSTPASTTEVTDVPVMLMGRLAHVLVPQVPAGGMIRVGSVDPASPPGVMVPAAGDGTKALQSIGMAYIDIVDAAGRPVAEPPAMQLRLMPFTPPPILDADELRVYQLGAGGAWDDRGAIPATQTLDLDRFGYWNADRAFRTACVTGKLSTAGMPCPGAAVSNTGPDGISSRDSTGADGSFCVMGAQTFASTLRLGTTTQSVQMPPTPGSCTVPASCRDLGTINVGMDQCAIQGSMCEFACGDGSCILASQVCNRSADCPDGSDEDPATCSNEGPCCVATQGCLGETGESCATSCCCCGPGQACCPDRTGCCDAP